MRSSNSGRGMGRLYIPNSRQSSAQSTQQTTGSQQQDQALSPLEGLPIQYPFDAPPPMHTGFTYPTQPAAPVATLPPLAPAPVAIDPLLAYGSQWLIEHDITQPPYQGVVTSPSYTHNGQWLLQDATTPGLACLTIYIQPIDRYIVVHSAARSTVTIHDVLLSVYQAVHEAVVDRKKTDHHLLSPQIDYHQGTAQGLEARHFSKTVFQQLLNGRHKWGGLTASRTHPETWVLYTK